MLSKELLVAMQQGDASMPPHVPPAHRSCSQQPLSPVCLGRCAGRRPCSCLAGEGGRSCSCLLGLCDSKVSKQLRQQQVLLDHLHGMAGKGRQ